MCEGANVWRLALCLAVLLLSCQAACNGGTVVNIKNLSEKPDFARLPKFYTSDPAYDQFANEWFMRHLTVDDSGVYSGGVKLGILDVLWVIEWDWWTLPWIDRGAMGSLRQGGSQADAILTSLLNCTIDKYGHVFGAKLWYEPKDAIGGWVPVYGWPWPKYNRNYTTPLPTGWEFNTPADGQRDLWTSQDVKLEPGYVDHSLVGAIDGPKPELISPKFDCDAFQIPIIELDIAYKGAGADKLINGLKLFWTTDKSPDWSDDKSVDVGFSVLPPNDFPDDYAGHVSDQQARYSLFFPMYLHPAWGRGGTRITRLRIAPTGRDAQGVTVSVNYIRASYDVSLTTTNATLINAAYKFYMWDGPCYASGQASRSIARGDDFLTAIMPRLRRSMLFMNEHMRGKAEGLIKLDWFVGKDGIGNECGRGVYGSYWDLLPGGLYDLDSNVNYVYALKAMAELERVVKKRGIHVPDVSVIGPDNKTVIRYKETPESLTKLAARVKKNIETRFWNPETGRFGRNIDVNGKLYDYGWLQHNLFALAMGIGTKAQRDSIVSWVNGSRIVNGDTSTGADIYHWRFGPRISTKRNEDYYYWAWPHDRKNEPGNVQFDWGNQMQDGGAVPFTSCYDLMARCSTGRQSEIDKAYDRTLEIKAWYDDVKSAGGTGPEFYRKYYDGHPERGRQQSPNPGGLGLDHEFLSDSSLGTEFLFHAFLGIDSTEDGIIDIAPKVPSQLDKLGCENVYYRGNHLKIEAGRGYVSLEGSTIPNPAGLKARVTLRNVPPGAVITGGKPSDRVRRNADGTVTLITDLRAARFAVKVK
jgi:hypothetical protein